MQGVYLGLAILMGGGLVLFGVGTGVGGGGLLNAFGGGSSNQGAVVSSAEKTALKATQQRPSDPAAWSSLVQARWTTATTAGADYNATTGQFTAAGNTELAALAQAYERYLALVTTPDANTAILAARAYSRIGQYGNAANAWEAVAGSGSAGVMPYECLALTSYAASQTRKGDLATTKALGMLTTVQKTQVKTALTSAKSSPSTAQQLAVANC